MDYFSSENPSEIFCSPCRANVVHVDDLLVYERYEDHEVYLFFLKANSGNSERKYEEKTTHPFYGDENKKRESFSEVEKRTINISLYNQWKNKLSK